MIITFAVKSSTYYLRRKEEISVTRLGDFLEFGQLFKALGSN